MANPFVHALVFIAAVLIPGGLLVYIAWRASRKSISFKANPNKNPDSEQSRDIPETPTRVEEVREAFFQMYPKESLRARSHKERLMRVRAYRRRNSEK